MITISVDDTPWVYYLCLPGRRTCLQTPAILPVARGTLSHRETCLLHWSRCGRRPIAAWFRLGTRQNGRLPNDDKLASVSREACVPLWDRSRDCRSFAVWFRLGTRQNGCLPNDDMLASGSREACAPLWGRRWDCRPFCSLILHRHQTKWMPAQRRQFGQCFQRNIRSPLRQKMGL